MKPRLYRTKTESYSESLSTAPGDSQASFSQSVRNEIRGIYEYRCVICLIRLTTTQCVHILDVATPGEDQVRQAVKLGVLPEGYQRNAPNNGMVLCPNCHSLFIENHIVLSLPIPVLKYLEQYVNSASKVNQKPLHEVFDLMVDALDGTKVDLPNLKAIVPYIGLFTLVTINPTEAAGNIIPTLHLPRLSVKRGAKFIAAPANTSATAQNAARIFEPLNINVDTPHKYGVIPISPDDEEFKEKRYWRLPVPAAAIFAALIARLRYDSSDCEEIILAHKIFANLTLKHYAGDDAGGSGPSGGRGGGRQSKRKGASGEGSASAERGRKRARNVVGTDCGESSDAAKSIDTDKDKETTLSISAIDPPNKDNPAEWRFGPSFSTNKIVFTARAVNLTTVLS